jgi:hypothetical protein
MRSKLLLALAMALFEVLLPFCLAAQSNENNVSLGELARELRKDRPLPAHTVIDNDNLSQVLDAIETQRLGPGLLFSFNSLDKIFQVSSSPDVTCNLSFNANANSLLGSSHLPQDLPARELAKLDGPASINGDMLQLTVYNGTAWDLKEITVGLTILRKSPIDSAPEAARLLPAVAGMSAGTPSAPPPTSGAPAEKRPDLTVLYHMKGSAAPFTTTVFHEALGTMISPDQDWHWAIVGAKGLPHQPLGLPAGK